MKWIFKNKLPVTVCFLLGIVTGCLAQGTPRKEMVPNISVIMPYDYCGEFQLFVQEDPDVRDGYNPGDRFYVFNMHGEHGAVARIPYKQDGWYVGFGFYREGQVSDETTNYRSWGENLYEFSPSLDGCENPIKISREDNQALVLRLEEDGQFPERYRAERRINFEPQIGVDSEYLYTEDGEHLLDEHGHPFLRYWHEDHPLYGSWDSKHILVLLTDTPHSLGYKRDGSSPSVPALRQFDLYDFYLHARNADGAFMYNEDGSPALVFHDGPRGAYSE